MLIAFLFFQVMETKNMLYIVSEYASQGEIFGKHHLYLIHLVRNQLIGSQLCTYYQFENPSNERIYFFFSDFIARYGKMSERAARQKFWQILSAVEYCHNRNIVHRDLKVKGIIHHMNWL